MSLSKPKLHDLSPMPFGKYKGELMQDVPANYLHWYWINSEDKPNCPVRKYIKEHLNHLKMEYTNGIW